MLQLGKRHIGLTLDSQTVRYVEAVNGKVKRYGIASLEAGLILDDRIADAPGLSQELTRIMNKEKLKGGSFHISIPTSHAVIRKIQVPFGKPKELRQLIDLEVQTMHLPFDNPVYDTAIMNVPGQEEKQAVVFAVPRDIVMSYERVMVEAGMRVKAVDLPAFAMYRVLRMFMSSLVPVNLMILNLTDQNIEMYMFSGFVPEFMRAMPVADFAGDDDGHWRLNDLYTEISRVMNFYQFSIHSGEQQINNIILMGGHPQEAELCALLSEALPEATVRQFLLDAFMKPLLPAKMPWNGFEVALGLAVKGAKVK